MPEARRRPRRRPSPRAHSATAGSVADSYLDGMQAAGPYLGLGAQIAASMALFCGVGYVVDRWLGTSPWGILVGAMLGMVGIVALLVRISREAEQSKRLNATRADIDRRRHSGVLRLVFTPPCRSLYEAAG